MNEFLTASSILGGFVGGMIALLAPCCVTVLLPAYFASAFTSVRSLVWITFLFGTGIAVVILPIALGLAALGQLFSRYHPIMFGVGGLFLLALGVMTLRDRGFELPFGKAPTFADRPGRTIFALGLFSGAASSCCAFTDSLAAEPAPAFMMTSIALGMRLLRCVRTHRFRRYGDRYLRIMSYHHR